jgi:antitoxin (DNA-binding transcriptional repressor) of toxin-antitoxin stability system
MEDVDIRHAKEHLEELIARAASGEDVRIVDPKYGSVKLSVTHEPTTAPLYPPRIFGLMKGLIEIPEDKLFEPLSEDELAWLSGENSEVK